jgi:hypothetical protein
MCLYDACNITSNIKTRVKHSNAAFGKKRVTPIQV